MKPGDLVRFVGGAPGLVRVPDLNGRTGLVIGVRVNSFGCNPDDVEWDVLVDGLLHKNLLYRGDVEVINEDM